MLEAAGTALLTIRAWCEEGSSRPFRAQIRVADDVAAGFGSTLTFADAAGVMEAVRAFLDGLRCPPLPADPLVTSASHVGDG
jgi:hypothetical protein